MPGGRLELPPLSRLDFESSAATITPPRQYRLEYQKKLECGSLKIMKTKPKVLVILGQTATGKSDLAVKIARKYNGEVISSDSRQVYKGLNIGTGKITKKEMMGVPHHMLDVVSPKKTFSVNVWKEKTEKIIEKILKKDKLPIICGGTGFYIQAIVDNITPPNVPPNKQLRLKLSKKTVDELFFILKKLDPKRARVIDPKNKVRLIRSIEIAKALGEVPRVKPEKSKYDFVQIGLKTTDENLRKRIHDRLLKRINKGMVKEAEDLYKGGLSFKRMRELGLEYRFLADYLDKKISKKEMLEKLETEIWHYAKRQMTWFKKDKRIKWFDIDKKIDILEDLIYSSVNAELG